MDTPIASMLETADLDLGRFLFWRLRQYWFVLADYQKSRFWWDSCGMGDGVSLGCTSQLASVGAANITGRTGLDAGAGTCFFPGILKHIRGEAAPTIRSGVSARIHQSVELFL